MDLGNARDYACQRVVRGPFLSRVVVCVCCSMYVCKRMHAGLHVRARTRRIYTPHTREAGVRERASEFAASCFCFFASIDLAARACLRVPVWGFNRVSVLVLVGISRSGWGTKTQTTQGQKLRKGVRRNGEYPSQRSSLPLSPCSHDCNRRGLTLGQLFVEIKRTVLRRSSRHESLTCGPNAPR